MSDHKVYAEAWLGAAERPDVPPGPVASSFAAIAQVHATLALVEQQRIANLIALAGARDEDGGLVFSWSDHDKALEIVREGLSL